jgi:hypothetical protein
VGSALPHPAHLVIFIDQPVHDFHRVIGDAVDIRLLEQLAVEIQPFTCLHLDHIAGQPDEPLHKIGLAGDLSGAESPVGGAEHHDVEPLRLAPPIAELADHHHIAHLQRGHHRLGRDVERLHQIGTDDKINEDASVHNQHPACC